MARLSNYFTISSGGTPNKKEMLYYENGTIPWVKTGDLKDKYVSKEIDCITEEGLNNSSAKLFPKDTVLVAMYGATIGACSILSYEASTNQACAAFLPNKNILSEYLFYFLSSKKEKFIKDGVGGAQPNISIGYLKNVEIEIVSLEEQQKIISKLNKTDKLIAFRKRQLEKLDQLVKARFVEMFGDPLYNKKDWDTDSVENLCSDIYGGGTPSKSHPEYYENGNIPWVSSKDMKTDVLYDSQIRINQLGVDNSTAKMVPTNSVIMVIRSGILKHTLPVAINAVPITVNQDLKVFIPSTRMLSVFLMYQFKMLEKDILSGVRAVTADNIEFKSLKERMIIVPPIDLQNKFAAFVEQVDKSKFTVQQSLDKLETLKKSLMQKYFG